jgi:hypothetical protein
LLQAICVEVAHLEDRWCLTQKPQEVVPTLVKRNRIRLGRRRKGAGLELLYFADEALDSGSSSGSFLALERDESRLVLLVREEQLNQTADNECQANQAYKDKRVFTEQRLVVHWISLEA